MIKSQENLYNWYVISFVTHNREMQNNSDMGQDIETLNACCRMEERKIDNENQKWKNLT